VPVTTAPAAPGRAAPGILRSLPAGLVDVALCSLANFTVGVYAARTLDAAQLGLWGLVFSAYLLAVVVPTELAFVPLEARLVRLPLDQQLRSATRTLWVGALPAVPAAVLAMALAAALTADAPATTAGRLAVASVPLCIASPMQDHLRRLMHQGGWSAGAALTAAIQLGAVTTFLVVLHRSALDALFVAPVALGAANVTSLAAGVVLTRRRAGPGPVEALGSRMVARVGGWLLGAGVTDRVSQFACVALLSTWSGSVAVGRFEAARVASQPVLVLALGVLSVFRRPLMAAAQTGDRDLAGRYRRGFGFLVAAAGLGYVAVAGFSWSLNPVSALTPPAFERAGFLAAVIGATALTATLMAPTTELVGSGRVSTYARAVLAGAVVLVAACVASLALGADVFAWPLALSARALLFGALLGRGVTLLYRDRSPARPGE
jgi:hypothetical protein